MKKFAKLFVSALFVSFVFVSCGMGGSAAPFKPYEDNAKDCANLRIYQVMVASFQDGDSSIGYTQMWGPDDALKGGDLQGIINSIDYIKGLGFNAIWMTPVFDSSSGRNVSGSHQDVKLDATGYYAYDFFNIDPNFGTIETFKTLVEKCHQNGIYVILDGVFGHWNQVGVKPSPSGKVPVRSNGMDNGCDYPASLDFFKEVATYWIKNYKIDGWRLDQCYQVGASGNGTHTGGHNYWKEIREAVKEACAENKANGDTWGTLGYMVGECWDRSSATIQGEVVDGNGLNSCFDFPSRYKIVDAVAREEWADGGADFANSISYVYYYAELKGYSHSDRYLPNLFITNHDVVRFGDLMTWQYGSDNFWNRTKVGLAVLAGYTGPITVYYGDEWGSRTGISALRSGGNNQFTNGSASDNSSRSSGKISGFTTDEQDLVDYVSKLMKMRSEHEALWNGYTENLKIDSSFYACKKTDSTGNDVVYVLFNYSSKAKSFEVGKAGKNLITEEATESTVSVPAYSAMFIQ